jgi:hypothetical protein
MSGIHQGLAGGKVMADALSEPTGGETVTVAMANFLQPFRYIQAAGASTRPPIVGRECDKRKPGYQRAALAVGHIPRLTDLGEHQLGEPPLPVNPVFEDFKGLVAGYAPNVRRIPVATATHSERGACLQIAVPVSLSAPR